MIAFRTTKIDVISTCHESGEGSGGGGGRGEGEEEQQEEGVFHQSPTAEQEKDDLNSLKIIYFNARSLTNKINDLCILISDTDPDLI